MSEVNPDFSKTPREELEVKITALLLGESTAQEAQALEQAITRDPELAALRERLKQTIALVGQVTEHPAERKSAEAAPLKLSAERREKLLRHFKIIRPAGLAHPRQRPRQVPWYVPMAAAAILIITVAWVVFMPVKSERYRFGEVALLNFAPTESAPAELSAPLAARTAPGTPLLAEHRAGAVRYQDALGSGGDASVRLNISGQPPAPLLADAATRLKPAPSLSAEGTQEEKFRRRFAVRPQIALPAGGARTETAPGVVAAGVPAVRLATVVATQPEPVAIHPTTAPPVSAVTESPGVEPSTGLPLAAAAPGKDVAVLGDLPAIGRLFRGEPAAVDKTGPSGQAGVATATPTPGAALPERFAGGYAFRAPANDNRRLGWVGTTTAEKPATEPAQDFSHFYDADSDVATFEARQATTQNFYNFGAVGFTQGPNAAPQAARQAAAAPRERQALEKLYAARQQEAAGRQRVEIFLPEKLSQDNEVAANGPVAGGKVAWYAAGDAVSRMPVAGQPNTKGAVLDDKGTVLKLEWPAAASAPPQRASKPTPPAEDQPTTKATAQATPPPVPQPEVPTRENAFSTFSLNVSDVSFKLAAANLEKGVMPEAASIRSEEFLNAFDYRDPEPAQGVPIGFAWDRARYPFAQNRDLLRFSVKTAAQGRQPGRALNLVLLLDNSGSMERADRVEIIRQALRVLATQLQPQDTLSVVSFSRTARLWIDGLPGDQAGKAVEEVSKLTPQGGTNLEEAMNLAYATALRHYLPNGINRVVLLTDGAANLGDVEPESLKQKVEAHRKQGIAFDCFGIGWEGYNDDLLEVLSRNGDGRYGFINTPEEAASEFVGQLAGALNVAASDVKVQVEFNPARVTAYRQIGYARHQLTKQQFRDNTVDAAEIGAAESGNALYVVEVNPRGEGPLGTVRVRYKVPGTTDYREHEFAVPYTGEARVLEQASPAMRLAATASAFSEWLAASPYAGEITPDRLLDYLGGVPETYGADPRPRKLEWMIRQAKSLSGK